jgi:hypothetical protein
MLDNRIFTSKLGEEHITIWTTVGCPQVDVLLPFLCPPSHKGFEVIGFADNLMIIVR